MSDVARGVVIAHGSLAAALVEAAERIGGTGEALVAVSNTECSREQIEARIATAAGPGPAVLFVDMPCGSCFFAAMHFARGREQVRVVTGVNLPMLLDFVNHPTLPPAESAVRATTKGTEAIRHP